MAQFVDYSNFIFNGVSSEMYDLHIVTTDSNNTERIFGLNSSFETQDGIGNTKLYVRRKDDTYSFDVEIMKLNGWNDVLPMSESEYDDIIRWLMVNEICPLQIGGLVHYGMFKNGTEFHNPYRQGIIKLEFESICPYAYTPVMISNIRVTGNKIVKLDNKSNINEKVYLDIYIEKLNSSGNIEIINMKNGNSFKIKSLDVGEQIRILGDGLMEVESLTNPNRNMFKDLEYKKFPYIDYGSNPIKIIGDCRIKFVYQVPVALR